MSDTTALQNEAIHQVCCEHEQPNQVTNGHLDRLLFNSHKIGDKEFRARKLGPS
jgi:hypothetical protein